MATKKDEQIEKIADLFYQAILDGTAPWTKEWKAADFRQLSHNPVSEKAYAGMNTLLLDTVRAAKGYESNGWLTFKQAKDLEGNIKKGEKGTQISFFSMLQVDSKKNPDEKEFVPMTKYYTVFNIDQAENLNQEKLKALYEKNKYEKEDFITNEDCQKVLDNIDIKLEHKAQERAYYSPSNDVIVLPLQEQFKTSGGYYSTAFHELGHATGHKSRLDRDLSGKFGTQSYAKEELRAEIYSFLQAKDLGMDFNLENHQSYIAGWVSLFKDKKTEIVEAVKDSFKMLDFVKENYIDKALSKDKDIDLPESKNIDDYKFLLSLEQKQLNQENISDDEFAKALKISKEDLHKRGFESEFVYIDDLKNNTNSLSEIVSTYKKDNLSKDYEVSKNEDKKLNSFSDKYDLNLDERTVLKELIKGYDKNDNSALEQIRAEMNNSTQVKNLDQVESKAHEQLETNSNNNTRRNK